MKIGLNIGHYGTVGAVGFLEEVRCNFEVYEELKPMLEKAGHIVVDCNSAEFPDYVSATKIANKHNLDLIISIHFNSHSNKDANGTEVLFHKNSVNGVKYATMFTEAISKALGTRNRCAKPSSVYIIENTKAPCVLIEGLFVSNREDCEKYPERKIALAIAECLGYKEVEETVSGIVIELSKHIQIDDVPGLIDEIGDNKNRLYWICKKAAEKFRKLGEK